MQGDAYEGIVPDADNSSVFDRMSAMVQRLGLLSWTAHCQRNRPSPNLRFSTLVNLPRLLSPPPQGRVRRCLPAQACQPG